MFAKKGSEQPPKHIALSVPPLPKKESAKLVELTRLATLLRQKRRSPYQLLQEALHHTENCNRCLLTAPARLQFIQVVLTQCYPVIGHAYTHYLNHETGIPETTERHGILCESIKVINEIAITFKILLKHDYESVFEGDEDLVDRIGMSGLRILELIRMEQRLRALRYQRLPGNAWADCNTVYFALHQLEHINDARPLLSSLGADSAGIFGKQMHSNGQFEQIFISIQLFGLLNACTWQPKQTILVDAYQNEIEPALIVTPASSSKISNDHIVICKDRHIPPTFPNKKIECRDDIVAIDISSFKALLTTHKKKLSDHMLSKKKIPSPVPLASHICSSDLELLIRMLAKLEPTERQESRKRVFEESTIIIHYGLGDSYHLLASLMAGQKQRLNAKTKIGCPSAVGGSISQSTTQWRISDESSHGLRLSAEEKQISPPIGIGQLTAYSIINDIWHLGYIGYIYRLQEKEIDIVIVRLTDTVELVGLFEQEDSGVKGTHGILIRNIDGHYQLITHPRGNFVPGTPMMIRRDHQLRPARLGKLHVTSVDFVLFDISGPDLDDD